MKQTRLSKFGKAVIVTAALMALLATAGTAGAQVWPYEDLNAVGYDSADTFGDLTNGGIYPPGDNVTIKATARSDFHDAVIIDVYDPDGSKIASHDFGAIPGTTDEFDVYLPAEAKEGYYEIRANGLTSGFFNVESAAIPEFTTIAVPVAGVLGLVLYFQRRRFKNN